MEDSRRTRERVAANGVGGKVMGWRDASQTSTMLTNDNAQQQASNPTQHNTSTHIATWKTNKNKKQFTIHKDRQIVPLTVMPMTTRAPT